MAGGVTAIASRMDVAVQDIRMDRARQALPAIDVPHVTLTFAKRVWTRISWLRREVLLEG